MGRAAKLVGLLDSDDADVWGPALAALAAMVTPAEDGSDEGGAMICATEIASAGGVAACARLLREGGEQPAIDACYLILGTVAVLAGYRSDFAEAGLIHTLVDQLEFLVAACGHDSLEEHEATLALVAGMVSNLFHPDEAQVEPSQEATVFVECDGVQSLVLLLRRCVMQNDADERCGQWLAAALCNLALQGEAATRAIIDAGCVAAINDILAAVEAHDVDPGTCEMLLGLLCNLSTTDGEDVVAAGGIESAIEALSGGSEFARGPQVAAVDMLNNMMGDEELRSELVTRSDGRVAEALRACTEGASSRTVRKIATASLERLLTADQLLGDHCETDGEEPVARRLLSTSEAHNRQRQKDEAREERRRRGRSGEGEDEAQHSYNKSYKNRIKNDGRVGEMMSMEDSEVYTLERGGGRVKVASSSSTGGGTSRRPKNGLKLKITDKKKEAKKKQKKHKQTKSSSSSSRKPTAAEASAAAEFQGKTGDAAEAEAEAEAGRAAAAAAAAGGGGTRGENHHDDGDDGHDDDGDKTYGRGDEHQYRAAAVTTNLGSGPGQQSQSSSASSLDGASSVDRPSVDSLQQRSPSAHSPPSSPPPPQQVGVEEATANAIAVAASLLRAHGWAERSVSALLQRPHRLLAAAASLSHARHPGQRFDMDATAALSDHHYDHNQQQQQRQQQQQQQPPRAPYHWAKYYAPSSSWQSQPSPTTRDSSSSSSITFTAGLAALAPSSPRWNEPGTAIRLWTVDVLNVFLPNSIAPAEVIKRCFGDTHARSEDLLDCEVVHRYPVTVVLGAYAGGATEAAAMHRRLAAESALVRSGWGWPLRLVLEGDAIKTYAPSDHQPATKPRSSSHPSSSSSSSSAATAREANLEALEIEMDAYSFETLALDPTTATQEAEPQRPFEAGHIRCCYRTSTQAQEFAATCAQFDFVVREQGLLPLRPTAQYGYSVHHRNQISAAGTFAAGTTGAEAGESFSAAAANLARS